MLTLFVVPSGKPNADYNKTVESFKKSKVEFESYLIGSWRDINNFKVRTDWFCVFWDNEGLDSNLQGALGVHLKNKVPEVFILYKRVDEQTAEYRTRFMKRSVWLTSDYEPISPWLHRETILDGWVIEHAFNDKH